VRTLVENGPRAIEELIGWGANFDRHEGRLAFGREGAHSRRRILHANGDSTGREISRTLYHKAAALANVEIRSFAAVTDLLVSDDGEAAGVIACDASTRHAVPLRARAVLMATGGLGQVYRETTNPEVATGDGVAAAYLAGAAISDIEFVQFHPTALHLPGAPAFLLSEALRGEGAYLRNDAGARFMVGAHPLAELAPRDIVARAIAAQVRSGSGVFLDIRHLGRKFLQARFPRICETCLRYGIDLAENMAPVRPAAHYAMGGVRTDLEGRTTVPRLYAAGEVASTGVHGANRLASNSLLEGVVFGARAGAAMRQHAGNEPARTASLGPARFPCVSAASLRAIASEACSIVRQGAELETACERLLAAPHQTTSNPNREMFELRSIHTVCLLIARCALARRESRGAHYRSDYPAKDDAFRLHSVISRDSGVVFA
jgi:L-aspartate oxidase